MSERSIVERALTQVKRNITEHVFLEIQRNNDLFREYVNLLSRSETSSVEETRYGEVNRLIGLAVKEQTGGEPVDRMSGQISTLVQSFTCFNPNSVSV